MVDVLEGSVKRPMRILLLITGLGVGGAERQVVDLADVFITRGHEVVLAYLTGAAALHPVNPRIRVVALGMKKGPLGFVRAAVAFRELNKSFRPDVVHSHLVHANIFARVFRIWITIPVLISSAHNTDEEGWWRVLGYRITDRLANISTNVNAEAVEHFERRGAVRKGRMVVVYNGVSTKIFTPILVCDYWFGLSWELQKTKSSFWLSEGCRHRRTIPTF